MKQIKSIPCKTVAKFICENLDEQIDSPLCRKIQKHLQECPQCAAKMKGLKDIVSLYRQEPDLCLPKSVHKRVIAALKLPE